MFKQIKNFFTEDAGVNRRKAPRVDARGEASVIIDGKSYRMKNWSTEGIIEAQVEAIRNHHLLETLAPVLLVYAD